LAAHRAPILKPRVSDALDWEAELLVVMGRSTGRYLSRDRALAHIFGYSCMNDGSLRDFQRHTSQFAPGKNFECTGGVGPWIVTEDEIADPMNLDIEFRLNGEVMQKANTAQMIHSIAATIEYITQWIPLSPGDLIATGTMGGVGFARTPPIFMKAGDVAEVDIESVGLLRNIIENEQIEGSSA
jgi:2-keto-4-pentenoate hydratase/2-oxohepta-3-ene-1,7-dioic acid hydratase in catechol pathway